MKGMPMIGSIIVAETVPARLAEISSLDDLNDFVCLELETMSTLDFQAMVVEGGEQWAHGEPIVYDPESGLAIFEIDEAGLQCVLGSCGDSDDARHADLNRLAEFVRAHGSSHFYEIATF